MPYPSEHASRQRDPADFEPKSFRRVNGKLGTGVDVIFGKLKGGKGTMVIQTIRFDASKFTPEQAKAWLKDHKYATTLEPAKKPEEAKKEASLRYPSELAIAVAVKTALPFLTYQPESMVSSLFITTTKEGKLRWATLSSSAFRDRDEEIVSTKALLDDIARADHDHDYGPLRWWHVPGVDIGDCDFNMLHGHILIESGTFRDPEIAAAVKEKADDLEVSIGFVHPSVEPDSDGIYYRIRRFERSLVPKGRVSNRTTRLIL